MDDITLLLYEAVQTPTWCIGNWYAKWSDRAPPHYGDSADHLCLLEEAKRQADLRLHGCEWCPGYPCLHVQGIL